jgi:hypothetical protein
VAQRRACGSPRGRLYTPFSADVTEYLAPAGPQTVVVRAFGDPLDLAQPRGKAGLEREGTLRRYVIHSAVSAEPRDVHLYARVR